MMELPLERVYYWERNAPQQVFLTQPSGGVTRDWTWAQTMDEARRMASHLAAKNWPAGSHIVIYSKNCAWWIMAELAIWMSGHVTVPIYPSLTANSARQLFEHCDAVACFLGPLDSVDGSQQAIPERLYTISFPCATEQAGDAWDALMKANEPIAGHPQRRADEIATIIYTSGTTGMPKGAMHRFEAFPYLAKAIEQVAGNGPQRHLSYLPLAHIAERTLTENSAIYFGWHLYFSEGLPTFLSDLKRAKATVFFSVPRLYARFQQKVFEKAPRGSLDRLLSIPVASRLVSNYILNSMGFGHVRFAASGSAALPIDLLKWFIKLGLPLTEGYGTTETGVTHTAPNGESRPGFAGKSCYGVETRISSAGEVQLRSPMNMAGYYKNEQDTREVFTEDRFLKTGDLGEATADGWLKITGRIKEQFKTQKGKFVAPAKIEALVGAHPAVENCVVIGANLSAPAAVAILTRDALRQAATLEGRQQLEAEFLSLLESINSKVEHHEHLALIALVDKPWTIDSGFITPTLKLRRNPLEAYYGPLLAQWLEQNKKVIWHLK